MTNTANTNYPLIDDCSMLSDQRTIAIVQPDASISWMCIPRVDSAAIFAHLMDTDNEPTKAGIFSIEDAEGNLPRQRYLGDTLILQSEFPGFHITDYLDASRGRAKHQAGRSDLVRVIEGSGVINITFAPRLNFGRTITKLEPKDGGLVIKGGNDLVCLRSKSIAWTITEDGNHHTATATVDLDAMGGSVKLELRCGTANVAPDAMPEPERRSATQAHWQKWVDKLKIPKFATVDVRRSAVLLKGLCYRPTGAILAAGTMSLPETIGGVRNWDYRYCWLRDSALTASALIRLGSHSESMALLDWVLNLVELRGGAERLNPLAQVTGGHLAPDGVIEELSGYRGSKPVRINNAADSQVQLDVFGPVVDVICQLAKRGEPLATKHWNLVNDLVKAVALRWQEEDAGIWEFRSAPRHYTYSKLMCWVAVDRAIFLAEYFTGEVPREWEELRDEIADAINTQCYKAHRNAYTSAYDGDDIDSSVLAIGLYGFEKFDDPRFQGTMKAVEETLLDNGTVFRYRHIDDGLPGEEGGFNIMTLWLVECYLRSGRIDEASKLFSGVRKNIGATGLLSEEVDPVTGEALGNIPQAYSHLAYINAAIAMAEMRDA